jgi:hypothetical protein
MTSPTSLRAVERCVLNRLRAGGDPAQIGRMFNRGPQFASRVVSWSALHDHPSEQVHTGLSPLERRVLRWRNDGLDHDEIGRRFRRGSQHIAQVERLARWKLARD